MTITVSGISGALFFLAFLPYMWATIHHTTVPSPVSWAIWAGVDTLALVAMKKKRADIGQLTGAVVGAWLVTLLALILGKPTMGSVEWASIIGALVGIILWRKYGDAIFAIVCCEIATFAGAIPTFVHGYRTPHEENALAWSIWLLSCVCALIAIRKKWTLANALQPLTFTTIETAMFTLVVIRPHL